MKFPSAFRRVFIFVPCLLIVSASLLAFDCPNCASGEKDAALCEGHAMMEKNQLPPLKSAVQKGTPEERVTALRAIAKLTEQHANAPSAAVADALALGLKDKANEVRVAAARLLGSGQHPAVASARLASALAECEKIMEKQGGKEMKNLGLLADYLTKELDYMQIKAKGKTTKQQKQAIKKQRAVMREYVASQQKIWKVLDYEGMLAAEIVRQSGRTEEAASSRLRLSFMSIRFSAAQHVPVAAEGLLAAGRVKDIELLVESLEDYQKDYDFHSGLVDNEKTLKQTRVEAGLAGDDSEDGDVVDDLFEPLSPWGEELYEVMRKYAKKRGLSELPEFDQQGFVEAAKAWFEQNRAKLSEPTQD